uniref:HNH endonuclease n=1 Tax=Methylomonas sp. PHL2-19 TaxID=3438878 RepID=UPI00402B58C3
MDAHVSDRGQPFVHSETLMAQRRKSLIKPRSIAFSRQRGRCYYCDQPMATGNLIEFSAKYKITPNQAKLLRCTGEHLKAHHEGGSTKPTNIVAACWYCNHKRHQRKNPPEPEQYRDLIQARMSQGGWHSIRLN